MEQRHNMEISWNEFLISIYHGGPSHEPYDIAVDIKGWAIMGSNKKIVATYVIGELVLLDWFMGIWKLKNEYCYNWCLIYSVWTKAKNDDNTISCAIVISVSTL